jgi:hypothetical protein
VQVTATDTNITRGTGGVFLGFGPGGASSTPTDTTGMHLDNVRVTPSMADTCLAATGFYSGVATGGPGATAGDENTSASFDGVAAYAEAGADITADLTVETWFRSTQGSGLGASWRDNARLLTADLAGSEPDLGLSLRSDGVLVAGVGETSLSSSAGLADGGWHHVALTRAGGTLTLYVDGLPVATGAVAPGAATTPARVRLGAEPAAPAFAGSLDEVAVYATALTAGTVGAHHAAGVAAP